MIIIDIIINYLTTGKKLIIYTHDLALTVVCVFLWNAGRAVVLRVVYVTKSHKLLPLPRYREVKIPARKTLKPKIELIGRVISFSAVFSVYTCIVQRTKITHSRETEKEI